MCPAAVVSRNARAYPVGDAQRQRPVAVRSEQGLPHGHGRLGLKKRVQTPLGIRFGTLNVGSLTGRCRELAGLLSDRRVNVACVQETRWKGDKARDIGDGYKLLYVGSENGRNGVGIVLDREFREGVLEVKRVSSRLMMVKVSWRGLVVNVISGYAPQVGLDKASKEEFWEQFDDLLSCIDRDERVFIGGDFNGHVGTNRLGYEDVHGGWGFGDRNKEGEMILEAANAHTLVVANTCFRKREEHLITFKSGNNKSQIDLWMVRKQYRKECKDCKVIPSANLGGQHRLVVLDTKVRPPRKFTRGKGERVIRWWALRGKEEAFRKRIEEEINWEFNGSVNDMWNRVASKIRKCGEQVLGTVKVGGPRVDRETWWWDEEVQAAIKAKKQAFRAWQLSKSNEKWIDYNRAKKEAKRSVAIAKSRKYEDLYQELGTARGEKMVYSIARARERKSRDIEKVRCIKDSQGKVLTSGNQVKERWEQYFDKLMNEGVEEEVLGPNVAEERNVKDISKDELLRALSKMKVGKAVGPDKIPVDVWKTLGTQGVDWLLNLFSRIAKGDKMPNAWREGWIVPIFKGKGDVQECGNYRGIKLMSHTLKLWERIIDARLREQTDIRDNQFGFMPGRSTMEPIFAVRQVVEKFRDAGKKLHMAFVDLEKAYDRVPRALLWEVLERKGVGKGYIGIIRDMYDGFRTSVRTTWGVSKSFTVQIGVHQGSALSPYLFVLVMDDLLKGINIGSPWLMLFADDLVLIGEEGEEVEQRLEEVRQCLEGRGLKVSREKTEHMSFEWGEQDEIRLGDRTLRNVKEFKYLGSVVQSDGELELDVTNRIRVGWQKWRQASGVLCDRRMPIKLKGKFYRTVVRPALLYGTECWAVKKSQEHRMQVAEMRMLRFMCGVTRADRIRNNLIRGSVGVADIKDKLRENRLRWYGHVVRRTEENVVRRVLDMDLGVKRGRGRPKQCWINVVKRDMGVCGVDRDLAMDRKEWRKRTHCADPGKTG